jgi:hypothetical protein
MQDRGCELPRSHLLGTLVNKGKKREDRGVAAPVLDGLRCYDPAYSEPLPNKVPPEASSREALRSIGGKPSIFVSQLFLTTSTPGS